MTKKTAFILAACLLAAGLTEASAQTTRQDDAPPTRQDRVNRDNRDPDINRRTRGNAAAGLDRLQRLREQSRQRVEDLSPPPVRSEPANTGRGNPGPVRTE